METSNVTLSLPKPLLQKLKVYAARQEKSMSRVMTELLEKAVGQDDEYEKARKRMLARMKSAPLTGWDGKITWTRDELYERGVR